MDWPVHDRQASIPDRDLDERDRSDSDASLHLRVLRKPTESRVADEQRPLRDVHPQSRKRNNFSKSNFAFHSN